MLTAEFISFYNGIEAIVESFERKIEKPDVYSLMTMVNKNANANANVEYNNLDKYQL